MCAKFRALHCMYIPFTILSNSDYLWKSDILVGSIVICHAHDKYVIIDRIRNNDRKIVIEMKHAYL
jgi:hypothetical protein